LQPRHGFGKVDFAMQPITAKIIHVQSEEGNRFYAEAEIVVPENLTHVQLIIDEICPEAHAPALSDVEAGTHTIPISGAGKSPFKVGDLIMARAFERGELPA
jgi:uncharacterized protein YqfB (UPF0267 family)